MTTEDDFHAMLAANPGDHATRLILADFLEDRGDPRGPGYRALALLQRVPVAPDRPSRFIYPGYCSTEGAEFVSGKSAVVEAALAVLPKDWLNATKKHLDSADPLKDHRWACADTARAIEDAAAAAFAKLRATRRSKLLTPPGESEKSGRSANRSDGRRPPRRKPSPE